MPIKIRIGVGGERSPILIDPTNWLPWSRWQAKRRGRGPYRRTALPEVAPPRETPDPLGKATKPKITHFPVGGAANDPVFGIWRRVFGKVLKGIPGIGSAEFLAGLADLYSQQALDKVFDELLRRRNKAREDRLRKETPVKTIDDPDPLDVETPERQVPGRPVEPTLPDINPMPAPDPGVIVVPGMPVPTPRIPVPTIPAPAPLPNPFPAPSPGPWPGSPSIPTAPRPFANPLANPFPFVRPTPSARPQTAPRPQTRPRIPPGDPLTPLQPPMIQSPIAPSLSPNLSPRQARARCRCKKDEKRSRRRRKCYKGLYREGPWSDQVTYTRWTQVNCSTGREMGKTSNVIPFPSPRSI